MLFKIESLPVFCHVIVKSSRNPLAYVSSTDIIIHFGLQW